MAFTDNTAFFAALKQYYSDQRVYNLVYENRPFFAMIKKKTDLGGYTKPIPLINSLGGPAGPVFANVQANQNPLAVQSFLISVAQMYQVATIKGVTIALSKGAGARAFLDATRAEIDAKYQAISNTIAQSLFLDGTYTLGKVGASVVDAGKHFATVTLADVNQIVNFEQNYPYEVRATPGGTQINDATANGGSGPLGGSTSGKLVITSIDRQAGTFVISGTNATDLSNLVAGTYLNVSGNSATGAATTISTSNAVASSIVGLQGWIPVSTPASNDSFWGVNRSADTRLSGLRFDGSKQSIAEALTDACAVLWREGARPDTVFTNAVTWAALEKQYEGKAIYTHTNVPVGVGVDGRVYSVGFKGMEVAYPNGTVKVYADPWCQGKTAYILQMEHWALESAGPVPQVTKNPDGLEFLRISNDDAFEVRMHAYCQMSCNAPGHNAVVTLAK